MSKTVAVLATTLVAVGMALLIKTALSWSNPVAVGVVAAAYVAYVVTVFRVVDYVMEPKR